MASSLTPSPPTIPPTLFLPLWEKGLKLQFLSTPESLQSTQTSSAHSLGAPPCSPSPPTILSPGAQAGSGLATEDANREQPPRLAQQGSSAPAALPLGPLADHSEYRVPRPPCIFRPPTGSCSKGPGAQGEGCLSAFPPSPGYRALEPSRFWSPLSPEDSSNPGKESRGSTPTTVQARGWGQLPLPPPTVPSPDSH